MLMETVAAAIATRAMLDLENRGESFAYMEVYALVHQVAGQVYRVMHEENAKLARGACQPDAQHEHEATILINRIG